MVTQSVDVPGILRVRARLGEAVVDPSRWRDLLEDMCRIVNAEGASLRQAVNRTPDVPYTASMAQLTKIYFREGWHLRDPRVARVKRLLASPRTLGSVFCDDNIFSYDEIKTLIRKDGYFNDFLELGKLRWGGWIRFQSAGHPWLIAFQRTKAQGPFEQEFMLRLSPLAQALTEVANLSAAVGHSVLTGVLDGLEFIRSPALAVDRNGLILGINSAAAAVFDGDFQARNGRLYMRDEKAHQALERMLSDAAADSDLLLGSRSPNENLIVARREAKRPILIKVMPVHGAARSPFLGAEFVLALRDLDAVRRPSLNVIEEVFSFTPTEAKVASMIAAGSSPERIADELNLARETVRTQLKAIFSKTGAHRQNELASLISRIQS